MSEKRKDSNGRILKTGESQRKDGTYMYRYNDLSNNRKYVYADNLQELRSKESTIQEDLHDGIITSKLITVRQLANQYVVRKNTNAKYNTQRNRGILLGLLDKTKIADVDITKVKQTSAKDSLIDLYNDGIAVITIKLFFSLVKSAFNDAVDDNLIRKNPYNFKFKSVISATPNERHNVPQDIKETFLRYLSSGKHPKSCYNDIVLLLETGMRVSEMYGLTKKDVDFENGVIHIYKQLLKTDDGEYYVSTPKTQSGNRYVALSPLATRVLHDVLNNRPQLKVEYIVDGYSQFLFVNKTGQPRTRRNLEWFMWNAVSRYNQKHADKLPHITPHMLRHTFCTEYAQSGMDIKSLQYLMGHANVEETLNIYSHADGDRAIQSMKQAFKKHEDA